MLAVPYDAKRLRPGVDEYLASEKLDGVRATWDGAVLRTRAGNVIEGAPDWFLASLPRPDDGEAFDGELFAGRGNFAIATSTVRRRRKKNDDDWRRVTYKIFDCLGAGERPYAETFARLRERVPKANLVPQIRVGTAAEIAALFERLVAAGAEGLMIRRADSATTPKKRSTALMKMKAADDAPAVVVAHVPGRAGSKYEGVLGALTCRWWSEAEASAASEAERSEAERSEAERSEAERGEAERGAAEASAASEAEANERGEAERGEAEATERSEASEAEATERSEAERSEAEATERSEAERSEAERGEAEATERSEAERSEAERGEAEAENTLLLFNVGAGLTDAQRRAGLPGIGATIRVRFASVDPRTGRPRHPVLVS